MGIGALNYQGVKGGIKLNDVIEEFKYVYKGQEIKAGDFVNYINGVASGSIGTDINAQVSDWKNSQAIEIDENRILIAYNNRSDINILKCQIYSLENAQLIAGTTYSITSPTTDYLYIKDIAMLEDKRFVILGQSYNSDKSSYYPLLFCGKIEGNTIIFGTAKSYLSNYPGYYPYSLCYTSNNKFIMGSVFTGNDRRVNCHIFSISDLTLPSSFTSVYNPSYYYCWDLRIRKISDTKVLIVWNNTSNSYIYTTTGTISNNTLSTSTVRTIASAEDLRNALSLSENLNLIIYTKASLPIIATYTTVIASINLLNTTNIPKIISMAENVGVLKTSENSIILAYGGTPDVNYSVVILPITNITENSATIGTTYLYPSTSKVIRDIINFQTNIIALLSSYQDPTSNSTGNSYLNLFSIGETISNQIIQAEYEQQVTPSTQPPFDGIALSNGVGGDDTGHNEQVKIARPITEQDIYVFETFTSSPIPTSWANGEDGLTATATNDYGEWSLTTTKGPWTTGTNLGVITDGNDDTGWRFARFSSDSEVAYMYLTPPTGVEINPTSIYVYNNMCSSSSYNSSHRSKVQGYDGSNWIDLGTLNSGTTGVKQTFTISGDTFFSEFRLKIYRLSANYNTQVCIFEFQVREGTIRCLKPEYQ